LNREDLGLNFLASFSNHTYRRGSGGFRQASEGSGKAKEGRLDKSSEARESGTNTVSVDRRPAGMDALFFQCARLPIPKRAGGAGPIVPTRRAYSLACTSGRSEAEIRYPAQNCIAGSGPTQQIVDFD
jgi:hypothetical protein